MLKIFIISLGYTLNAKRRKIHTTENKILLSSSSLSFDERYSDQKDDKAALHQRNINNNNNKTFEIVNLYKYEYKNAE